ncbi:MAG: hypothetical protein KGM92_00125 [Acidobacteriota bacterium]|jgi:hypothetical protein|nr:hypothetical protein [Acidobacteriota bacterium]
MRAKSLARAACLGLLVSVAPALAHHSFAAEYDTSKPIKVTGVVTKMEWMNPHARFYVDVKEADGTVSTWNFELGAIPVLLKQGWRKDALKPGDQVTVEGNRAKDESHTAAARVVLLPDGRRVFGGSAADGSAPPNQ